MKKSKLETDSGQNDKKERFVYSARPYASNPEVIGKTGWPHSRDTVLVDEKPLEKSNLFPYR